jgi:hypothetical protein
MGAKKKTKNAIIAMTSLPQVREVYHHRNAPASGFRKFKELPQPRRGKSTNIQPADDCRC